MGKTQLTGNLTNAISQDASNNVGIGAAPSGTYKLEVTGTAKVSSTLLVSGAATFSSTITAVRGTMNGTDGDYAFFINGGATAGSSYGLRINAGGNSSDYAIRTKNAAQSSDLFVVRGDGNVGIGTAAPATQVEIYNSTTLSGFRFGTATATESQMTLLADLGSGYDNGGYIKTAKESTSNSYLSFGNKLSGSLGEKMRITSGGNVAINAGGNLQLYRPDSSSPSSSWFWNIYMSSSNLLNFAVNGGTAKMYLNASGTLAVGITTGTANGRFCIEGDGSTTSNVHLEMSTDANRSYLQSANRTFIAAAPLTIGCSSITIDYLGTGNVYSTGGVLSIISDMNLKIEDGYLDSALDKVLKLKPRYFLWKEESGLPTDLRQLGFYAQEVNEILGEEAANTPKENVSWGINDRAIIAFLTKAIQEQQDIITSLQDRLDKAGL
jgi:hypothetical protein